MLQGPYANSSVSSMSLGQSNQSDSPNGKITPAVFLLLMQWFLTGGTRITWGYEEPKQGVRSTKVFRDTRSGNLNRILLNIHRDSL